MTNEKMQQDQTQVIAAQSLVIDTQSPLSQPHQYLLATISKISVLSNFCVTRISPTPSRNFWFMLQQMK